MIEINFDQDFELQTSFEEICAGIEPNYNFDNERDLNIK